MLGDGEGDFGTRLSLRLDAVRSAVAISDINLDGRPDLVATPGAVQVLLASSNDTFPASSFAIGGTPSALAVADLNGDGLPDIITANADATSTSC